MISSASSRSPISAAPAQPLSTLLAGQPMLMSQTSAPSSSTTRAASAMVRGVGAVDLDRERPLLVDEVHQLARLRVAADDRLGGDELHRHQPDAADAPHDQAEVAVGDPRHRREEERRIDR